MQDTPTVIGNARCSKASAGAGIDRPPASPLPVLGRRQGFEPRGSDLLAAGFALLGLKSLPHREGVRLEWRCGPLHAGDFFRDTPEPQASGVVGA